MNVLVTGGAGFIGSHVVNRLVSEGWQVTVLDNLCTGLKDNVHPQAAFVHMDIRSQELSAVFKQNRFDYVIHLAAQTAVPVSLKQPDFDCEVNVMGTVNVLEACRANQVKKLVFASSAAVYGDVEQVPVKEDSGTSPTSFYGLSKLTVERYLELYQASYGVGFVVLRYANVYGERQGDAGEGGVVSIFCRKLRENRPVIIYGTGEQSRDFIYAGDVAEANFRAMTSSVARGIYNISTQSETTVNQLFNELLTISGKQIEKKYEAAREGDIYRSSLANAAAIRDLAWRPKVSLREGLARTYQALK